MSKECIIEWLKTHQYVFTKMAQAIWEHPQVAYEEKFASELQLTALNNAGFSIRKNIGGASTAFVAQYGSGSPKIGILGVYDALPGLAQSGSTTGTEGIPNGSGHGCGHNLLGTAGVEAVMAIKEMMDKNQMKGTIRYYGCPGEEMLPGKTFMAREGVFDDLDCALTWNPGTSNSVMNMSTLSMISVKFHFKGMISPAAEGLIQGKTVMMQYS